MKVFQKYVQLRCGGRGEGGDDESGFKRESQGRSKKIAMMLKLDVAKHDFQVETGSDTDVVKVVLEKAMPQDEKAPQGKKTELNISGENSENTNPSEASKKNKKKKKKPAPATAEEIGKKVDVVEKKEDVKEVLGEIGDNGGENATEVNVIIFFWQVGPT